MFSAKVLFALKIENAILDYGTFQNFTTYFANYE